MTGLSKEAVCRDLEEITSSSSGCRYWRVDLHTHTPASGDSRWSEGITPHEIVAAYAGKGISLIATTDHSTGAWIDKMKDAGRKFSKRHKTLFTVLPGVELHVQGTHIAAIFPESATTETVKLFLGRLRLRGAYGAKDTYVDNTISEVAAEAKRDQGILIGCHCNSGKGVVEALTGKPRTTALQSLDCLEIHADQSEAKRSKTVEYVRESLGFCDMPFIFSSDAHAKNEIIGEVSLLKMDMPCFLGLKQLLYEPVLRSAGTTQPHCIPLRLLGLVVNEGIYRNTAVQFSPDLNVIIGGRGAGKSALMDLIRFALGFQAVASDFQTEVDHRLAGFLNDGEEVRLYVEVDSDRYCICHQMESRRLRGDVEMLSKPVVYRLREAGPLRENIAPSEFFPVDIYGQGEVLELTRKGDDQLTLLDGFADLQSAGRAIDEQLALLEESSVQYFKLIEQRVQLDEAIAEKKQIEDRIAELAKHLDAPVFKEHESWQSERVFVESVEDAVDELECALPDKPYKDFGSLSAPENARETSNLHRIVEVYDSLLTKLRGLAEKESDAFVRGKARIEKLINTWKKRYDAAQRKLESRLKKLDLQDVKHVYEERATLQGRLGKIERDYEPKLSRIDGEIDELNTERSRALIELDRLCEERYQLRQETAQWLADRLPDNILVSVEQLGNDDAYFGLLHSEIYEGSGIRSRERHVQTLVSTFSPRELAALIRAGDEDALKEGGLTEDAARKVVAVSEEDVRRIEEVVREDRIVIGLRREGESDFVPLEKLSLGEKCSAILSIALVGEDRPLLIDEPEAELDHDFICNNVVESIRDVKGRRQIITCTHNPNIPVLGDAELVVKVSKVAGEPYCCIDHIGGFEHERSLYYLKQLEGGEDALRRRSRKYQLRE